MPLSSMSHIQLRNRAVRRVQRDMRALENEPVDCVACGLDEENPLLVYANMVPQEGPYAGVPIHLHLSFPEAYPDEPPSVEVRTDIRHPNVFDWEICLDMLDPYSKGPYQGWSAAYDVAGVLRQLYGFLLVDTSIDQDDGGQVSRERRRYQPTEKELAAARKKRCRCGFRQLPARVGEASVTPGAAPEEEAATPIPPPPPASPRALGAGAAGGDSTTGDASGGVSSAGMGTSAAGNSIGSMTSQGGVSPAAAASALPLDVVGMVIDMAGPATVVKVAAHKSGDALTQVAAERQRVHETCCFHSKQQADGSTVLGYGVAVQRHPDGNVKSLSLAMDLLSYESYQQGVRRSAWNVPFKAFLPLALNSEHAQRALPVLEACLPDFSSTAGRNASPSRPAVRLLDALACMMNSLVVEMLQCDPAKISRHISDAALHGFCHLHHLLLTVVTLRPNGLGKQLQQAAVRDVLAFINQPAARDKRSCPDLGVLLIKLLLVPMDVAPWSTFAPLFVRELLARQVRWLEKPLGANFVNPWASYAYDADGVRAEETFTKSATGLRLVALEAWFANALARPMSGAADSGMQQLGVICDRYNRQGGRPPAAMLERFNRHAKDIARMSKWASWFAALRLRLRDSRRGPQALLADLLRQACLDSANASYHRCSLRPPRSMREYVDWGEQPVSVVSEQW